MDYIREELLRQKNILSVLMTGGRNRGTEEHESVEAETLKGGQGVGQQDNRSRTLQKTNPMLGLSGRRVWSGEGPEEKRRSGFRGDRGTEWRMKNLVGSEESVELFRAPHEPVVTETVADARALSRSIQRDARRYDGGFSLY